MIRSWTARLVVTVAGAIGFAVAIAAQVHFSTRSDLAVLHVAVTDDHGLHVAGLGREAFTVIEDGVSQPITVFTGDDTPATIGLLIDDSASMLGLRAEVTAAVGAFVETGHPADEHFAMTFNEQVVPVLPPHVPYTSDAAVLRLALQHAITARGRTALRDAVLRGINDLEAAARPRTALVIVSDGGDNASRHSVPEVHDALAGSNTVVYAVALPNEVDADANPRLLKRLAEATGGLSFTPRNPSQISAALVAIARDIRGTYTLAYPVPPGPPGVRHVRVNVRRDVTLHARTRRDYLAR